MQGSRFIDSNIVTKKQQDRLYLLHQKKLQEINSYGFHFKINISKPLINKTDSDILKINHQKKAKSVLFHQTEKERAIRKENQFLMDHLLNIGEGKKSQFRGIWNLQETSDNKRLMADTSIWKPPTQKRLNSPLRRKELLKIEEENYALAQRIVSKRSNFELTRNNREIEKYENLRSQMTKYKTTKTAGSAIKLPPVEEGSAAKYLRTLSQEKKKDQLQDPGSYSDQYKELVEELQEKQKELLRLRQAEEELLQKIQEQEVEEEKINDQRNDQKKEELKEVDGHRVKKEVPPLDQSQLVTEVEKDKKDVENIENQNEDLNQSEQKEQLQEKMEAANDKQDVEKIEKEKEDLDQRKQQEGGNLGEKVELVKDEQ